MLALEAELEFASPEDRAGLLERLADLRSDARRDGPCEGAEARDSAYALVRADLALAELGPELTGLEPAVLYAEARDAAQCLGDGSTRAHVEWRRALRAVRRGELPRAEALLRAALDELDEHRGMEPVLQVELAELLRSRGEAAEASALLERAEAGLRDLSDGYAVHRATRCALLGARGQLWLDVGLPDLAAPDFAAEEALATELGDLALYASAQLHGVHLELALEDYAAALARVEAFEAAEWSAWVDARTRALLALRAGLAASELARSGEAAGDVARGWVEPALAAGALGHREAALGRVALLDLALRAGELAEAAALASAAREEVQAATRAGEVPTQIAARLAAYEAELALERGDGAEVLRSAAERLDVCIDGLFERWRRTPLRPRGLGFLHYGSRRHVLGARTRLHLALEGPEAGARSALALWLRAQALGSLGRRLDVRVPSVEEVTRFLDKRVALVYLPGPDRSHLLVLARGQVRHALLPPTVELDRRISAFVSEVLRSPAALTPDGRADRARRLAVDGEALAEALLPAIARDALTASDALTLVGIEGLGYVPFEALPVGEGGELGLSTAVDYLASLPLGVHLAARARDVARLTGPLIVADPPLAARASGPLAALEPLGLRLSTIEAWDGGAATVLLGEAASREGLRAGLEARPRLLDLFTHGTYDPERGAGLLLAPAAGGQDILWCADAEGLAAPPRVILSACGAARGPRRRGDDGLAHLAGAFLFAGARVVLSSPADLELASTLERDGVLHRELARGASPAEALRAARVELARREAFADPFYRCLVHAHGLGQEGVRARIRPASSALVYISTGMAGLLALRALRRRRRRRLTGSSGSAVRSP